MVEHTKENQLLIISNDRLDTSTDISKLYLIQSIHDFLYLHNLSLKE